MFDHLFERDHVIAKHYNGPLATERENFLRHLEARKYARRVIRETAITLMVVVRRMGVVSPRKITWAEIETAAQSWAKSQTLRKRSRSIYYPKRMFRRIAIRWFQFLGWLEPPAIPAIPEREKIDAHHKFLRDERGLSESTIRRYGWHATRLLKQLDDSRRSLRDLSILDVDAYLSKKASEGWQRRSLRTAADALRSFVRYAEQRRWCRSGIVAAIDPPRIYQQESLVSYLQWRDVNALLKETKGDNARDIRDRAILLLLARYGLRGCEVRALRLEDIDWEHDLLLVKRSKQRCTQQYPLDSAIGSALLRYLRKARPVSPHREVFLTLRAPFVPLCQGSLYNAVRSRLDSLGVSSVRKGPHALRHACAHQLLNRNFSLKQIGDYLGHRSVDATRMYTKIDTINLREVAEIDLRGLI